MREKRISERRHPKYQPRSGTDRRGWHPFIDDSGRPSSVAHGVRLLGSPLAAGRKRARRDGARLRRDELTRRLPLEFNPSLINLAGVTLGCSIPRAPTLHTSGRVAPEPRGGEAPDVFLALPRLSGNRRCNQRLGDSVPLRS